MVAGLDIHIKATATCARARYPATKANRRVNVAVGSNDVCAPARAFRALTVVVLNFGFGYTILPLKHALLGLGLGFQASAPGLARSGLTGPWVLTCLPPDFRVAGSRTAERGEVVLDAACLASGVLGMVRFLGAVRSYRGGLCVTHLAAACMLAGIAAEILGVSTRRGCVPAYTLGPRYLGLFCSRSRR